MFVSSVMASQNSDLYELDEEVFTFNPDINSFVVFAQGPGATVRLWDLTGLYVALFKVPESFAEKPCYFATSLKDVKCIGICFSSEAFEHVVEFLEKLGQSASRTQFLESIVEFNRQEKRGGSPAKREDEQGRMRRRALRSSREARPIQEERSPKRRPRSPRRSKSPEAPRKTGTGSPKERGASSFIDDPRKRALGVNEKSNLSVDDVKKRVANRAKSVRSTSSGKSPLKPRKEETEPSQSEQSIFTFDGEDQPKRDRKQVSSETSGNDRSHVSLDGDGRPKRGTRARSPTKGKKKQETSQSELSSILADGDDKRGPSTATERSVLSFDGSERSNVSLDAEGKPKRQVRTRSPGKKVKKASGEKRQETSQSENSSIILTGEPSEKGPLGADANEKSNVSLDTDGKPKRQVRGKSPVKHGKKVEEKPAESANESGAAASGEPIAKETPPSSPNNKQKRQPLKLSPHDRPELILDENGQVQRRVVRTTPEKRKTLEPTSAEKRKTSEPESPEKRKTSEPESPEKRKTSEPATPEKGRTSEIENLETRKTGEPETPEKTKEPEVESPKKAPAEEATEKTDADSHKTETESPTKVQGEETAKEDTVVESPQKTVEQTETPKKDVEEMATPKKDVEHNDTEGSKAQPDLQRNEEVHEAPVKQDRESPKKVSTPKKRLSTSESGTPRRRSARSPARRKEKPVTEQTPATPNKEEGETVKVQENEKQDEPHEEVQETPAEVESPRSPRPLESDSENYHTGRVILVKREKGPPLRPTAPVPPEPVEQVEEPVVQEPVIPEPVIPEPVIPEPVEKPTEVKTAPSTPEVKKSPARRRVTRSPKRVAAKAKEEEPPVEKKSPRRLRVSPRSAARRRKRLPLEIGADVTVEKIKSMSSEQEDESMSSERSMDTIDALEAEINKLDVDRRQSIFDLQPSDDSSVAGRRRRGQRARDLMPVYARLTVSQRMRMLKTMKQKSEDIPPVRSSQVRPMSLEESDQALKLKDSEEQKSSEQPRKIAFAKGTGGESRGKTSLIDSEKWSEEPASVSVFEPSIDLDNWPSSESGIANAKIVPQRLNVQKRDDKETDSMFSLLDESTNFSSSDLRITTSKETPEDTSSDIRSPVAGEKSTSFKLDLCLDSEGDTTQFSSDVAPFSTDSGVEYPMSNMLSLMRQRKDSSSSENDLTTTAQPTMVTSDLVVEDPARFQDFTYVPEQISPNIEQYVRNQDIAGSGTGTD